MAKIDDAKNRVEIIRNVKTDANKKLSKATQKKGTRMHKIGLASIRT